MESSATHRKRVAALSLLAGVLSVAALAVLWLSPLAVAQNAAAAEAVEPTT